MAKKESKKPGRPPTMGKAKMRSLRIPIEEWDLWVEAADSEDISVTSWIRKLCNAAVKRAKKK